MSAVRSLAVIPIVALAPVPLNAQAPATGNAAVRGTVADAGGRPLPGAAIIRVRTNDTTRADSAGRFAVTRLPVGRHVFLVSHPGFETIEMEITFTNDTTVNVDIPLEPARADAISTKLDRVGFTQRRRQAPGGATFLGPEELARQPVTRVTQMLEGVRDITLQSSGGVMVVLGADRRCIMNLWIEGRPDTTIVVSSAGRRGGGNARPTSLDEKLGPGDVAGIEVYPRPLQVPGQFQLSRPMSGGGGRFETRMVECGALVIWTRQ